MENLLSENGNSVFKIWKFYSQIMKILPVPCTFHDVPLTKAGLSHDHIQFAMPHNFLGSQNSGIGYKLRYKI